MALFQKAEATQAYLKMGIYGNAGSGKTYTASQVAKGLVNHIQERVDKKVPVMFLDTETGSSWIKPLMEEAGIEFMVAQTRAFTDLQQAVKEAEDRNAVLIIDSITHFWTELTLSLAKQRKRKYNKLEFQDYATLKPMWGKFTEAFLNSKAHIIICGRAGNTYEYQDKEDDDGRIKKELITTGTKMKAETEMGYEPSLLVEMVAEKSPDRKKKLTVRRAYVLKDRSTLLDGREFIDPGFKVFIPHINRLNIGGDHMSFDASRTSEGLFDGEGRSEWQRTKQQKEIRLDEIHSIISKHYPGRSTEEQKMKSAFLENHFGTVSWKRIEETYTLHQLDSGYESLFRDLEKKSPYIGDDDIPDFVSASSHNRLNGVIDEATPGKQPLENSEELTDEDHEATPAEKTPLVPVPEGTNRTQIELKKAAKNIILHMADNPQDTREQLLEMFDQGLIIDLGRKGLGSLADKVKKAMQS